MNFTYSINVVKDGEYGSWFRSTFSKSQIRYSFGLGTVQHTVILVNIGLKVWEPRKDQSEKTVNGMV